MDLDGGVFRLAPEARLDDGLLDVVVVGDIQRVALLVNIPRVFAGRHLGHEKVEVYRVRSLLRGMKANFETTTVPLFGRG